MSDRELKILIIDDDEQSLFALCTVFQSQRWVSVCAKDVPTGLELLRTEKPDLVIIEYQLPGIEGIGGVEMIRALDAQEDEAVCAMINAAGADIVWVGLGAPKQERWMAEHQGRINGLMIGVGAGVDYHAGKLSRAPQWMQRSNLEWLYRLLQEPKRLFRRYLHTNLSFIWHAVLRGR